jgi:hypothetical protein
VQTFLCLRTMNLVIRALAEVVFPPKQQLTNDRSTVVQQYLKSSGADFPQVVPHVCSTSAWMLVFRNGMALAVVLSGIPADCAVWCRCKVLLTISSMDPARPSSSCK